MCLYINICHWQLQNQYVEINGAFLVSCFKLTRDVKGLITVSSSWICKSEQMLVVVESSFLLLWIICITALTEQQILQ